MDILDRRKLVEMVIIVREMRTEQHQRQDLQIWKEADLKTMMKSPLTIICVVPKVSTMVSTAGPKPSRTTTVQSRLIGTPMTTSGTRRQGWNTSSNNNKWTAHQPPGVAVPNNSKRHQCRGRPPRTNKKTKMLPFTITKRERTTMNSVSRTVLALPYRNPRYIRILGTITTQRLGTMDSASVRTRKVKVKYHIIKRVWIAIIKITIRILTRIISGVVTGAPLLRTDGSTPSSVCRRPSASKVLTRNQRAWERGKMKTRDSIMRPLLGNRDITTMRKTQMQIWSTNHSLTIQRTCTPTKTMLQLHHR